MPKETTFKAKPEVFVRINSRISVAQNKYIKALATKFTNAQHSKVTEGEVLRSIIQAHMDKNKLQK